MFGFCFRFGVFPVDYFIVSIGTWNFASIFSSEKVSLKSINNLELEKRMSITFKITYCLIHQNRNP